MSLTMKLSENAEEVLRLSRAVADMLENPEPGVGAYLVYLGGRAAALKTALEEFELIYPFVSDNGQA